MLLIYYNFVMISVLLSLSANVIGYFVPVKINCVDNYYFFLLAFGFLIEWTA